MDAELSRKKMMDQVELLRTSGLLAAYGWSCEVKGMDAVVQMASPQDNKTYKLRVNFDDFPQQAASYLFDGEWPQAPKIQQGKGICIDGTRECYTSFKHGDRFDDFDPGVHTLPSILQRILNLMRK